MGEIGLWIIVGLCLIAFGVGLYLLVAFPMKFYYKKEIAAFAKLSDKYGFEKNLGKAGLKPNFPVVKGFYKYQYFIVKKALSKHSTMNFSSGSNTRTRKWYIQISTKISDTGITEFSVSNTKALKDDVGVEMFGKYIKAKVQPEEFAEKILTDDIKKQFLSLAKVSRYFTINLDREIYYTSCPNGLTKPEHVEDASRKIEMLQVLASKIKSIS